MTNESTNRNNPINNMSREQLVQYLRSIGLTANDLNLPNNQQNPNNLNAPNFFDLIQRIRFKLTAVG